MDLDDRDAMGRFVRDIRISEHFAAAMQDFAAALADVPKAVERFDVALVAATEEWADVVLEDILDAEYLGEE